MGGNKGSRFCLLQDKAKVNMFVRKKILSAIYCPDSIVLMLHYCANLKAIRYESRTLNGIVADKSQHVIEA